jgi:hypothetical protein
MKENKENRGRPKKGGKYEVISRVAREREKIFWGF